MQRVVQIGLGPIGRAIAELAGRSGELELVGAVDPAFAGRDLGELTGGEPRGIAVDASVEPLLERARPTLALHATGSFLPGVRDQILPLLGAGLHVVSTCEELSFPFYTRPDLARELDSEAARAGVVLLGTGINPGFVMDKLVVTLMAACESVRRVRVVRVVDAATRREPFQRKIGAGLTPEAFAERKATVGLGHVGLPESAHMLAEAMGVGPQRTVRDEVRPVVAEEAVASEFLEVRPGQVAGIDQTLTLEADGAERVHMELQMYLGAPRPRDAASLDGVPCLEMEIAGGVAGDGGTAAVTVHSAVHVHVLAPGLRTMLELPLRPGVAGRAPA